MITETIDRVAARRTVNAPEMTPQLSGSGWHVFSGAEGHAIHLRICETALVYGAPQSAHWADAWEKEAGYSIVYAVLTDSDTPILSLPLQIVRKGGALVAQIPGDSHANGSFPAMSAREISLPDLKALGEALRQSDRKIDLLLLERLHPAMNAVDNPLQPFATNRSVDADLASNLEGGWEGWQKRNSGKKKRKKHRQDTEAFETLGPISIDVMTDPADVADALDAFFDLKAARFAEMGVEDVFGEPAIRSVFHRLAQAGLGGEVTNPFDLTVLRVAGEPIAVAAHSLLADRMVCEFSAFAPIETDIRSVSPSLYMHFESIRRAADLGLQYYDFSVGEDEYKKRWCDTRTELFDVAIGFSLWGKCRAAMHRVETDSRRALKANPRIMNTIRAFRRKLR